MQTVIQMDPGSTGNLEVVMDGTLLHGRKGNGDGYVDTDAKMAKILDGIAAKIAK